MKNWHLNQDIKAFKLKGATENKIILRTKANQKERRIVIKGLNMSISKSEKKDCMETAVILKTVRKVWKKSSQ
jgi:hypothetical protein